jgi:hypothetical protein
VTVLVEVTVSLLIEVDTLISVVVTTAGLGEGQAVETSSSDGGEGEEGGEGDGVASSLSTLRILNLL